VKFNEKVSNLNLLLLLLPIIDLIQQFEDYVKGIVLQERNILTNNKISLKIYVCTKAISWQEQVNFQ
jgi:hypothetical protein